MELNSQKMDHEIIADMDTLKARYSWPDMPPTIPSVVAGGE